MAELDDIQQTVATATDPAVEFSTLSGTRQRDVFFRFPDTLQASLVAAMDADQLLAFGRRRDPDELTDVLALAPEKRREHVLRQLDADRREKVEFLLGFEAESAGGLMWLNTSSSMWNGICRPSPSGGPATC